MLGFLKTEAERKNQDDGAEKEPLSDADVQRRALEQVCRVILNLNEFAYPD